MIELFIADVSGIDIESALSRVSEYRRDKALRCASEALRRQSLGAELLLYRALGGGKSTTYSIAENGKPYFENGPCFSLSHSGKYAVCAIADTEVGVDIESPRGDFEKLAKRFFSEAEYADIMNSAAPEEQFCLYWVKRESYIKATGKGLRALSEPMIPEYSTAHTMYDGYYIGLCVKGESTGNIRLHVEEIA